MRYLLDTHTLIWSQDETDRLGATALGVLGDPRHELVLSIVTVWAIGIKVAIRKLQLSRSYRQWIETAITDLGLKNLPISLEHVEGQMALPFHHRDPFDRMLIAQAMVENIPLVSGDTQFDAYGGARLRV